MRSPPLPEEGRRSPRTPTLSFTLYLLDTIPCLPSQSIQTYYSPSHHLVRARYRIISLDSAVHYHPVPPQSSHTSTLAVTTRCRFAPHATITGNHPILRRIQVVLLRPAPSRLLSSNVPRNIAATYATPASNQPVCLDPLGTTRGPTPSEIRQIDLPRLLKLQRNSPHSSRASLHLPSFYDKR